MTPAGMRLIIKELIKDGHFSAFDNYVLFLTRGIK